MRRKKAPGASAAPIAMQSYSKGPCGVQSAVSWTDAGWMVARKNPGSESDVLKVSSMPGESRAPPTGGFGSLPMMPASPRHVWLVDSGADTAVGLRCDRKETRPGGYSGGVVDEALRKVGVDDGINMGQRGRDPSGTAWRRWVQSRGEP